MIPQNSLSRHLPVVPLQPKQTVGRTILRTEKTYCATWFHSGIQVHTITLLKVPSKPWFLHARQFPDTWYTLFRTIPVGHRPKVHCQQDQRFPRYHGQAIFPKIPRIKLQTEIEAQNSMPSDF